MPPKTTNKDAVEALLSDLDSLDVDASAPRESKQDSAAASTAGEQSRPPTGGPAQAAAGAQTKGSAVQVGDDAQSLLDDLDSLVQRRAPTARKAAPAAADSRTTSASLTKPSTPLGADSTAAAASTGPYTASSVPPAAAAVAGGATVPTSSSTVSSEKQYSTSDSANPPTVSSGEGAKGWGGWWSSATKLADQARAEIERRAQSEQAKELSQRGWGLAQGVRGYVEKSGWDKIGEDLGKVGKRGWTEVVNAVAPPISAHEVIQVTLSHDMVGFDGVPDVTFKVLSRVLETQQLVESGVEQQLVVNKAPESRKNSSAVEGKEQGSTEAGSEDARDMNAIRGFAEAWKIADSSLSKLIAEHDSDTSQAQAPNSLSVPVTKCPIFVRIQPCLSPLVGANEGPEAAQAGQTSSRSQEHVHFLILLQDPTHGLSHRSVSQSVPSSWLSLSFDDNPWIEQSLVDALEGALSVTAQEYINGRQSGRSRSAGTEPA